MFFAFFAAVFLMVFAVLYVWDRRRISNGIFLTIGLFFLLLSILYVVLTVSDRVDLVRVIVTGVAIILFLLIPFFFFGLIFGLIMNGRTMMKKEGKRLANLLPMFAGLGLLALFIWGIAQGSVISIPQLAVLYAAIITILTYFTFFFVTFLISCFVYQYNFPRYNQDFIIVLGSGLIGDKVPPLLASRLDKAISFYKKQLEKKGKQATMIVSGGQGEDELTSEANAMRLYLLEKGIPEDYIMMEDKSVNTLQNMRFSKAKMDAILPKYNSIFTTNNFHLFRAGLYAKKAGLKSQGIGSKTAFYYMPSALMREFIAVVMMHKKLNLMIAGLILLMFLVLFLISFL
ncbi:YdcF family protein [Listeria sp. ILCC792]|uniref:YdcF family protein n=1 Tax=Listeria sp. ILCC792 TaxID=1918331 RepID=UPI000B58BEC2|nr:YdcF family protein [Listeria sp. ILCC792]